MPEETVEAQPDLAREDDKTVLLELTQTVIRAQGNSFIKELLRKKGLRTGRNKESFTQNLSEAITSGVLTLADVEEWLAEVEGWGNQHVYLFEVPRSIADSPDLASTEAFRTRVINAGLGDFFEAPTAVSFPPNLTLSSIRFADGCLTISWHQGDETLIRTAVEKRLDFQIVLDDDLFEFHAHRHLSRRGVVRFELDIPSGLAAIFLGFAFDEPEHVDALTAVGDTLSRLLDYPTLKSAALDIGNIIKHIDQAKLAVSPQTKAVSSQLTRLEEDGGYVEFGSHGKNSSFLDFPAVANVRRSIRKTELGQFSGGTSAFKLLKDSEPALSTDVRVDLYGSSQRIRLWKQLERKDVWTVLSFLAQHR